MPQSQQPRSRAKSILALVLVFGPALFLILISTRRCEHKFKQLDDYGLIQSPAFEVFENGVYNSKKLSDYKGDLIVVTTIQTTCPKECGISLWHFNQILFQHIRKNKRKKLKQVRLISFATDEFGRPATDQQIKNIREMLQDDIEDYDPHTLEVFSRDVLNMISNGKSGWEEMLPIGIAELIKKHCLFGYDPKKFLEKSH